MLKDIEFNAKQLQAVEMAQREPVSILTGGPGTGKTTVCREIVQRFLERGQTVLCAAPTGKASKRFSEQTGHDASTIHRMLVWRRDGSFQHHSGQPLYADVVIIDEVSMLDIILMSSLVDALATGTKLLLVGDADQLPPVGPGSVLRDMLRCGKIPVTSLTKVYRRSEDSWLHHNANCIVKGDALYLDNRDNKDFFFMDRRDKNDAAETVLNLVTKIIPRRHKLDPVDDVQVLCPMKAGVIGVHNINRVLHKKLNPYRAGEPSWDILVRETPDSDVDKRSFRLGDKVMQMRNNYKIGVFNGEIGRVIRIEKDALSVSFDDRICEYDYKASYDLQLCYASTVHKSQGSEYPCVVMVVHSSHWPMLWRAVLYTGVTRAEKVVYVVGDKRGLNRALSNDEPSESRRTSLDLRLERVLV